MECSENSLRGFLVYKILMTSMYNVILNLKVFPPSLNVLLGGLAINNVFIYVTKNPALTFSCDWKVMYIFLPL